jgi:hypothetical protein
MWYRSGLVGCINNQRNKMEADLDNDEDRWIDVLLGALGKENQGLTVDR